MRIGTERESCGSTHTLPRLPQRSRSTAARPKPARPPPPSPPPDASRRRRNTRIAVTVVAALLASSLVVAAQNRRLRAALANVADMAAAADFFEAFPSLRGPVVRPIGALAAADGARPKHPTILIPGFVTSALELWSGPPCAAAHFRSRFWGGISMTQRVLGDRACWLEVMRLDDADGRDPRNATGDVVTRLRAVEGLAGVDYFMPGYGVWASMIAELAAVGYSATNLFAAPYDWRLGLADLEARDGYFTRLAATIEAAVATSGGEKAAVVAHSWGDAVARSFFAWADAARAPGWTAAHVAHYVNVAGPTLGAAKAVPALLSGETRDTAELGALAAFLSDNFVSRAARSRLFRSWGGSLGMVPLGGAAVWGNASSAPDDGAAMRVEGVSFGAMLTVNGTALDADAAVAAVLATLSPAQARRARATWFGPLDRHDCAAHGAHALRCALPSAPDLQVTCLYGVGKPTERAYVYSGALDAAESGSEAKIDVKAAAPPPGRDGALLSAGAPAHPLGGLDAGVRLGDGDGTVNLVSLGALCARHWREKRLNPAGARVVTREARHEPLDLLRAGLDPRGGPRSADHVDVLSHEDVLRDVVAIVTGTGGELEDRFHSNVRDVAARVHLPP